MILTRLIYASHIAVDCRPAGVRRILESARKNNAEACVTGLLCYDPLYFVQWLEGGRAAVNRIFGAIARDRRHEHVTILDYSETPEREFADWSMAYVATADLEDSIALRYCPTDTFNPMTMSAESARRFMLEIARLCPETLGSGVDAQ